MLLIIYNKNNMLLIYYNKKLIVNKYLFINKMCSILKYIKKYPNEKKRQRLLQQLILEDEIKRKNYTVTHYLDSVGKVKNFGTVSCGYEDCNIKKNLELTLYNDKYVFCCVKCREKIENQLANK